MLETVVRGSAMQVVAASTPAAIVTHTGQPLVGPGSEWILLTKVYCISTLKLNPFSCSTPGEQGI